jgi:hypothetical protein
MKKFGEYLEESLAAEVKTEPKTMAAKQARKMGLTYMGFGRYADSKGQVAYTVIKDKLVPYKRDEHIEKLYDKADMTNNVEKANEYFKQADELYKTKKIRAKEDKNVLSAKSKEVIAVAKQLSSLYRPEMFDDAELQAIQDYTGDSFIDINRYLYKGHDEGVDANRADVIGQTIDALDSAFEETEAPFPFTVYSGLSGRYRAEKIVPGNEYIFRGYISTSLSHDVAISSFTDSKESVVLQIEVGKGQKAIYVDSVSSIDGELETLLPRGSKVKIISGPHPLPTEVVGFGYTGEAESKVNLFHCKLVQDT